MPVTDAEKVAAGPAPAPNGNGRPRLQSAGGLWPATPAGTSRRPGLEAAMVLALCLLAFALRVHELDASSLWLDEGFTVRRIGFSMGEIVTNSMLFDNVVTQDSHPALYFILLKLYREMAGGTTFALKYYSVAWGVVLVPLSFAAGRLLISRRAGRAAALFAALSPIYLWYSQELRMYTQVSALSLLAVYLLARASQRGYWWRWLLAAGAMAAAMYTHYSAFFVAAFEVVALAVITYYVGRMRRFIALALALLSTAPLLILVMPRVFTGAEIVYGFVPLDVIARDLLNGFSMGTSVNVYAVWWIDLIFLAVVLAGVLLPFKRLPHDEAPAGSSRLARARQTFGEWLRGHYRHDAWYGARWLLLAYLVLPVLAYYAFTFIKPAYLGVRHLIVVGPAFYLLLARGIDVVAERARPLALALVVLFVGGMSYSTAEYFTNPRYLKDDWRSLISYLELHAWPRDAVVVYDSFIRGVLDYYSANDGLEWVSLPELGQHMQNAADRATVTATLEALRAEHPRIWLVGDTPLDGRDPDRLVEQWFQQNTAPMETDNFWGRNTGVGMRLFASQPILDDEPPRGTDFAGITWQHGPMLWSYKVRVPAGSLTGGMTVPLQLVWYAPQALDPGREYSVHVGVVDTEGVTWAGTDAPLAAAPILQAGWPAGKWALLGYTINLPPGLAPGTYALRAALFVRQNGVLTQVPVHNGREDAELTRLAVTPTVALPDERRLSRFTSEDVRFESGLALLGYRLTSGALRPGQSMALQLFWRALRDFPSGQQYATIEFVDALGVSVARGDAPLGTQGWDPSHWRQSQIGMAAMTLRLPGRLGAGTYRLRVTLFDHGRAVAAYTQLWPFARYAVEMGPARVVGWPVESALPEGITASNAIYAQQAALAGYHIDGSPRPGAAVKVTLYWRVLKDQPGAAAGTKSYVHVVAGGDRPLALHDSAPGDGERPVDTWRAGEIVADAHLLRIPADAQPGAYALFAGLYDAESGARWPVTVDGAAQPNNELHLLDLLVEAP